MCLFLLLLSMGGNALGDAIFFTSWVKLRARQCSPVYGRLRQSRVHSNLPPPSTTTTTFASIWRWKMSKAATFEVFIPQAEHNTRSYDDKQRVNLSITATCVFYDPKRSLATWILTGILFHSVQLDLYHVYYSRHCLKQTFKRKKPWAGPVSTLERKIYPSWALPTTYPH